MLYELLLCLETIPPCYLYMDYIQYKCAVYSQGFRQEKIYGGDN